MQSVSVPLSGGRDYTIHIGSGLRASVGECALDIARSRRAVVITQPKIMEPWARSIAESLTVSGFGEVSTLSFPAGERYKTLRTVESLCAQLYECRPLVDRKTLLVAVGGGVVGDVVGFVAAIYLRGLDYIQVPTTLLAMVDSSVGGKTGVDFHEGKNLIGAFHQPRAVWIDTDSLSTLPIREYHAGLAEVVKYGVIRDPSLFDLLLTEADAILRREPELIQEIVRRSCEIKADVVTQDEFETTGLRAILNYGHTIGHAIEGVTGYRRFKHGEAIAIGMMAAAYIGEEMGITPRDIGEKLLILLSRYRLPVTLPPDITPESLLPLLGRDKKAEGGRAKFVLAREWSVIETVGNVEEATILSALRRITGEIREQ